MTTTVYLSKGREAYNRLYQGPTWGLTKASRKLAKLARNGDVQSRDINKVLSDHAKFALRLQLRGVAIGQIEQGMSQANIAKMFRAALYNSRGSEYLKSFGINMSTKAASGVFPNLSSLHQGITDLESAEINQMMNDLAVTKSVSIKTLEFLRKHRAILVTLPITMAITYLSCEFNVISQFIRGEESELSFGTEFMLRGIDVLLGVVGGLLIVGLPTQEVDRYLLEEQTDATTGRALEILDDFAKTELGSLESRQISFAAEILDSLPRETCLEYLSTLDYEKVQRLYPEYQDKEMLCWALIECKDTPWHELFTLVMEEEATIARAAFQKIKSSLDMEHLKFLTTHKDIKIRKKAFAMITTSLTKDDLAEMAKNLINIPDLFIHPEASHEIKVQSLLATAQKEPCQDLFELFTPWLSADDVHNIITALSKMGNSRVAEENLEIFLGILGRNDDRLAEFAIVL